MISIHGSFVFRLAASDFVSVHARLRSSHFAYWDSTSRYSSRKQKTLTKKTLQKVEGPLVEEVSLLTKSRSHA